MVVLEPIVHETIWGGSRISQLAGISGEKIGHLYSVFCRDGLSNRILNGEWSGKCLNDVFPLWKKRFHMEQCSFFPLTLALTEADEHLSIQVHPDDQLANTIEHKARGKRESWYFLEEPVSGYIYNGCICKNEKERDKFLQSKKYMGMADILTIKPEDYVFVEPGTLHAITAGSLVYEIEEGADFTYRFFDYDRIDNDGRMRELHVEKATVALCLHKKSTIKHYRGTNWIDEATYSTKRLVSKTNYRNDSSTIECLTLIRGQVICDGIYLRPGMTVMLWPDEAVGKADLELAFVSKFKGEI